MRNKQIIEQAATAHFQAERTSTPCQPLSVQYPEMTLEDGYAIQKLWVDKKVAQGQKVIGYKIGYTSRAMQKALNINEPDFGVLLDSMAFNDGAKIDVSTLCDPRIGVELHFI